MVQWELAPSSAQGITTAVAEKNAVPTDVAIHVNKQYLLVRILFLD